MSHGLDSACVKLMIISLKKYRSCLGLHVHNMYLHFILIVSLISVFYLVCNKTLKHFNVCQRLV